MTEDPTREIRAEAERHFQLAYEAHMQGRLEEASAHYQRSIALHPTAEAHTFLGWVYSHQGRPDDAIAQCKIAISVVPEVGVHRDRDLALGDRVVGPPLVAVDPAQEGVGLRGGVERDRSLVVRARLLQTALHVRLVRLLEVALRLRADLAGRILRHLGRLLAGILPQRMLRRVPRLHRLRYARRVRRTIAILIVAAVLAAGCSSLRGGQAISFDSATPGAPLAIDATLVLPSGPGPFPAVVDRKS